MEGQGRRETVCILIPSGEYDAGLNWGTIVSSEPGAKTYSLNCEWSPKAYMLKAGSLAHGTVWRWGLVERS